MSSISHTIAKIKINNLIFTYMSDKNYIQVLFQFIYFIICQF